MPNTHIEQGTYTRITNEMIKDGYAFVPFNSTPVTDAQNAYQLLLRSVGLNQSSWSLSRLGESEAELGFVSRSGVNSDKKTFFHFAYDLSRHLKEQGIIPTKQQQACLKVINTLYQQLKELAICLANDLDLASVDDKPVFGTDILELVRDSFEKAVPYGASVLRFVDYPNVEGQSGAREHHDKDFFSIHLGDEGGELLALINGVWVPISPPKGYAVVFFGVKAYYVSKGDVAPLRHKAITVSGQLRQAAVMFVHIDVGVPVLDAQEFFDSHALQSAAS